MRDAGYTRRPTLREMSEEEPEQEPVACPHRDEPRGCYRVRCQLGRKCVEPLFTHPPRRTGLPHCERSCEANAFNIEIRRLTSEVRMLQEQNTDLDRKLAELERNA